MTLPQTHGLNLTASKPVLYAYFAPSLVPPAYAHVFVIVLGRHSFISIVFTIVIYIYMHTIGMYRVNYTPQQWAALSGAVRGGDWPQVTVWDCRWTYVYMLFRCYVMFSLFMYEHLLLFCSVKFSLFMYVMYVCLSVCLSHRRRSPLLVRVCWPHPLCWIWWRRMPTNATSLCLIH